MTKRDNHIFRTKILTPLRELDTFNSSAAPSLQILCGFRDKVIKSNLGMRRGPRGGVLVSGRARRVNLDELIHHEKVGRKEGGEIN